MEKQIPCCYQCKLGFNGCEIGRMVILYYSKGYAFEFTCEQFDKIVVVPAKKESQA